MFSLRLSALILYDSLHGESQICCLSHHREMATATQPQNNTTKQSNHRYKKHILQSVQDTEHQHILQSIQDTEQHSKTKLNSENSHECGMTRSIGLSKTQSKQIQLHFQASPPFPDSSKDADNPLQWQVNLESATSQLFKRKSPTF